MSFSVAATGGAVATVRRRLTAVLSDHHVGDDARGDVELLVSEVVGNFVRHEGPRTLGVEVALDDHHRIVVAVLGGTHGASRELVHAGPAPGAETDHGRGLTILDSLAQAWGTRRQHHRTAVWFAVLDLDPEPAERTCAAPDAAPASVPTGTGTTDEGVEFPNTTDLATQRAASITRHAVREAARTAASAADAAREAKSLEASEAALAIAGIAERAVIAARSKTDGIAAIVASAAAAAAATVRDSLPGGGDAATAAVAYGIAAAVTAAAAAAAAQADDAAALVAKAVATAAAIAAASEAADIAATEIRVQGAATALRAVAADTAGRLAAASVIQTRLATAARQQAAHALTTAHHANLGQTCIHDRSETPAVQQALTTTLSPMPGITLAARYVGSDAAGSGNAWYDVVSTAEANSLVMGAVISADIAATDMGRLRNLLPGFICRHGGHPADAIFELDQAVRDVGVTAVATLLVVSIDPSTTGDQEHAATLHWANAGHPPPILILSDGTTRVLDRSHDLPLGVRPRTPRHDITDPAPPGATVLLYTDGLVETRRPGSDTGRERLLDSLSRHADTTLEDLLDVVLSDLADDQPFGDVALLAARIGAPDIVAS